MTYSNYPSVSVGADGGFIIAWDDCDDFNTKPANVHRRRYASDGTPIEGQLQVNTYTTSYQCNPSVASGAGENFVVVWQSDGSSGTDSDGYSVQRTAIEQIFADGFESGDTSAWSVTTEP